MFFEDLMYLAQSMLKIIMVSKKKIDEMTFTGKSELVEVKMNGKRDVLSVEIKSDELEKDDLEILEDMIKIATNDALKQIEKEVNNKLGSQAGALGGLL